MKIKKFRHVKNNKVVYAVIGTQDINEAMNYVYKYKKAEYTDFYINHDAVVGSIYKGNLYVNTIFDVPISKQTPCIIVFRKTIDVMSYV